MGGSWRFASHFLKCRNLRNKDQTDLLIVKPPLHGGFILLNFFRSGFFNFRYRYCLRGSGSEFLYSSGGVDELLVARIKGVAFTANFYVHRFLGGASRKSLATSATDFSFFIVSWMGLFLHTLIGHIIHSKEFLTSGGG